MEELASFVCDSCGEEVEIPLDLSAGRVQRYTLDCPICCRPNLLTVLWDREGRAHVDAECE